MSKIRSSKTGFENNIFRELRKRGVYFKSHYTKVVGKPDIALPKIRKVVFLHSDFWHGWRLSKWEHVLPNDFWKQKLKRNRKRDQLVLRKLRKSGWRALVIWEHSILQNKNAAINKIIAFMKS